MPATEYPGASNLEILEEPDWTKTHGHRVGIRGRDARFIGLTHGGDEKAQELEEVAEAKLNELREKAKQGNLLNVRDIMEKQIVNLILVHHARYCKEKAWLTLPRQDFHLEEPRVHPKYWRYVLHTTESFIKQEQLWPINNHKKEEAERNTREKAQEEREPKSKGHKNTQREDQSNQEEENDKSRQDEKTSQEERQGDGGNKDTKPKLSLEEKSLLQSLQYEQEYRSLMKDNDGKSRCPLEDILPEQIDEADQFSPDNWIPPQRQIDPSYGEASFECRGISNYSLWCWTYHAIINSLCSKSRGCSAFTLGNPQA